MLLVRLHFSLHCVRSRLLPKHRSWRRSSRTSATRTRRAVLAVMDQTRVNARTSAPRKTAPVHLETSLLIPDFARGLLILRRRCEQRRERESRCDGVRQRLVCNPALAAQARLRGERTCSIAALTERLLRQMLEITLNYPLRRYLHQYLYRHNQPLTSAQQRFNSFGPSSNNNGALPPRVRTGSPSPAAAAAGTVGGFSSLHTPTNRERNGSGGASSRNAARKTGGGGQFQYLISPVNLPTPPNNAGSAQQNASSSPANRHASSAVSASASLSGSGAAKENKPRPVANAVLPHPGVLRVAQNF